MMDFCLGLGSTIYLTLVRIRLFAKRLESMVKASANLLMLVFALRVTQSARAEQCSTAGQTLTDTLHRVAGHEKQCAKDDA